jgi:tetratricopeptide (TPR) repeat protein
MLGRTLGGRYQITRHLGGGGFGQTFLAEDLHLPGKPQCVVKQLKPRMTNLAALQTARRLFETEVETLYSLGSHEQIPRLFAHFEENSDFYLAQEFIQGETLSHELKNRQRLTESEVIHLLLDILNVLEFVHQQQVIHRDIKPSNLIRRSSDRRLILIDFGAVKQIGMEAHESPQQVSMTIAVGSSGYMPNEQLAGKPRFSSDIYAVGMLALQCLTGINPKNLPEDPKTSEILWRDQVEVSPELADILDRMVRYDFRQRYPSAKEALEALRSVVEVASVSSLLAEPKSVSFDGHLAWFERAEELFQQQRYREAVTAYDLVLQAKPDHDLAWFKRGIALENLHHYEDAIASYEQVLQLQPQDYLAWFKLGSLLQQVQRYPEALKSYGQVVELQPENYWAWHDRGRVLECLQRWDEAIASYDRAVQLKPDFQLAIDSRKRILSQLCRVDVLYHLQHYDEVVASCDRAIEQNPADSLAWLMRGMAMENLQRYEEALAAYDRVVAIQPDDQVAWFKQATVLEKLNQVEAAIAAYRRVVQIQPDNYWAWYDQGKLLEQTHQLEDAIICYDRVVQLKPDFDAAIAGRQRILGQQQRAELDAEAEEDETIVSLTQSANANPQLLPDQALAAVIHHYKQQLQMELKDSEMATNRAAEETRPPGSSQPEQATEDITLPLFHSADKEPTTSNPQLDSGEEETAISHHR